MHKIIALSSKHCSLNEEELKTLWAKKMQPVQTGDTLIVWDHFMQARAEHYLQFRKITGVRIVEVFPEGEPVLVLHGDHLGMAGTREYLLDGLAGVTFENHGGMVWLPEQDIVSLYCPRTMSICEIRLLQQLWADGSLEIDDLSESPSDGFLTALGAFTVARARKRGIKGVPVPCPPS